MNKIVDAFETVRMPEACETEIRRAIREKRNIGKRKARRLQPVAVVLVAVVLALSFSTEVRAEVKEVVQHYSGSSFFASLRTREIRRKGRRNDADGGRRGVIIAEKLNVRSDASYDSKIVASLRYGDRIEIVEERNGWVNIHEGWIDKAYVYEEGTTGSNPGEGTIISDQVNIRIGPGTDYAPVGTLSLGDQVDILEQVNCSNTAWGYVGNGWICMNYVELHE